MGLDLIKIQKRIYIRYPIFGSLLTKVRLEKNDIITTAATNGKVVFYNEKFLSSLDEDGQVFVLAHELCHVAFGHLRRSKDKDMHVWNIATDAVINALLVNDGFDKLDDVIDMPEAINYTAEEMYQKLLKDKENGDNKCDDLNVDNHNQWQDSNDFENQPITNNEKYEFENNSKMRKENFKKMKKKMADTAAGKENSNNIRSISSIGVVKPLIEWRIALKEAVNIDNDWSYKNAVIENGVLVSRLEDYERQEVEILLDVSGSISDELLKSFLRECKHIFKVSRVKIGCFDTQFHGFHEIKSLKDIEQMNFHGHGGTNFEVAIKSFSKRVPNRIIFTDGKSKLPKDKVHAIWVVFDNEDFKLNYGKVIHVSAKDLMNHRGERLNKS